MVALLWLHSIVSLRLALMDVLEISMKISKTSMSLERLSRLVKDASHSPDGRQFVFFVLSDEPYG